MATAREGAVDEDVPQAAAMLAAALRDAEKLDADLLAGAVTHDQLQGVRAALDRIAAARDAGLAALPENQRDGARAAIAAIHARAAAVAIVAGDHETANDWLARGAGDPIAASAPAELEGPRPLEDTPRLWSVSGCGLELVGRRDARSDGSYVTTHCVCVFGAPIFPLAAYRVLDGGDRRVVVAREPVPARERRLRYAIAGAVVAAIAITAIGSYLTDPERLAQQRFDRVLELAERASPEAAIEMLDEVLADDDRSLAGDERAARAGAEIIRLTVGMAPKSPGRDAADHASRLVQRFDALPYAAQGTLARETAAQAIAGWLAQLAGDPGAAEVRLALLERSLEVATSQRASELAREIARAQVAVAAIKAADWPLDALHTFAAQLDATALAEATKVVARLVDSPSLLVEAGGDLDRWLAATRQGDPLRDSVMSWRAPAAAGRKAAGADGVTTAELEAMAKQRPWDQYVQVGLARADGNAGKLDAAAARLGRIGPPGMMVREARLLLAQLASARGQLEQADALLTGLLAGRIERYLAANDRLQSARATARAQAERVLRFDGLPSSVAQDFEAAIDEQAKAEVVDRWMTARIDEDVWVISATESYLPVADIVPVSLTAGTVKLRRAQAMSGPARDAMLREAERTFLSIRSAAEDEPESRLGLGEIYARLGKTEESESELAEVLALDDPELSLRVASTYRSLGSTGRAIQVARAVFDKSDGPMRSEAAVLLAILSAHDEAESERWFRAAESSSPQVRASLLELEARRLLREGNHAACAAKLAEAARLQPSSDSAVDTRALDNAAIAGVPRPAVEPPMRRGRPKC